MVAGGSDGIGVGFARSLAARGLSLVLVFRRATVLDAFAHEVRGAYPVEVRTVVLDLSEARAMARLAAEAADFEVGLFVANAGGDDPAMFLERNLETHLALVQRNCSSVLDGRYQYRYTYYIESLRSLSGSSRSAHLRDRRDGRG